MPRGTGPEGWVGPSLSIEGPGIEIYEDKQRRRVSPPGSPTKVTCVPAFGLDIGFSWSQHQRSYDSNPSAVPQKGEIFHQDMPQRVLRDVFGLGLFENMSVGCNQSRKDETKFDVDLQVKERPAQTGDLELEWALVPSPSGKPGLASPIPGTPPPPLPPPFPGHCPSAVLVPTCAFSWTSNISLYSPTAFG